jgi:hypothetical protein
VSGAARNSHSLLTCRILNDQSPILSKRSTVPATWISRMTGSRAVWFLCSRCCCFDPRRLAQRRLVGYIGRDWRQRDARGTKKEKSNAQGFDCRLARLIGKRFRSPYINIITRPMQDSLTPVTYNGWNNIASRLLHFPGCYRNVSPSRPPG